MVKLLLFWSRRSVVPKVKARDCLMRQPTRFCGHHVGAGNWFPAVPGASKAKYPLVIGPFRAPRNSSTNNLLDVPLWSVQSQYGRPMSEPLSISAFSNLRRNSLCHGKNAGPRCPILTVDPDGTVTLRHPMWIATNWSNKEICWSCGSLGLAMVAFIVNNATRSESRSRSVKLVALFLSVTFDSSCHCNNFNQPNQPFDTIANLRRIAILDPAIE